MADIHSTVRPTQADRIETAAARNLPKWVRHLSAAISSAFDCRAIHHPAAGKLTFIGVGADVQVAVYTYTCLERTVRRLCGAYMKQHAGPAFGGRRRELIRHSYCLGAVATIARQLQEQRKRTPVTPGALVPVKEGLIRKAMDEIGPLRTMHSRRSHIDVSAYGQGQTDGAKVSIHKGVQDSGPPRGSIPEH
jgi:hypothetical protein